MTIKELYDYAKEKDLENCNLLLNYYTGDPDYDLYQKKLDISSLVRCGNDITFDLELKE